MISTRGLSVRYGEHYALRDVSLAIPAGRITAIVGPSGCGKTSFLAALNRMTDLIPGAAVEGRVQIGGQDVHDGGLSAPALRRRIGMLFQRPNPFAMSIRRNVQLALRDAGERDRQRLDSITRSVLEDVGLWAEVKGRLDTPAHQLSGGQQQRLCLARALALEPEALLMDEPCSALDPIAAGVVEDLIRTLRGRYTIVLVTHNLAQARRLADELAVFWLRDAAGVLLESGPAAELFAGSRDPVAAAYLQGMRG